MVNFELVSPTAVVAEYRPQHLPQFKSNPMVEALPKAMNDAELFTALTSLPEFTSEQLEWSAEDRIQMILCLSNFMIPLERHMKLGRALDSLLRGGYVGRIPRTVEHTEKLLNLGSSSSGPKPSPWTTLQDNPRLSTLLMGPPGMGKTTTVKRFFSNFPQVIFHPDYNVYQITYLHIEMPSDGSSVKALAHGILHALDKLIPGAKYYETYARKSVSGEVLMFPVAKLLAKHFVGFLIADEIQNLLNARTGKSKDTVMTEVVSACNTIGIPILFVGTNKAARVFQLDARTSRRANGHGLEHWDRLDDTEKFVPGTENIGLQGNSEWKDFLNVLWTFQWTRNFVPLDASFEETMYHLSQGVIDVAIKLFASAQVRAISNKSEKLTVELLTAIYEAEMAQLHPMLTALRNNDAQALSQYPDITPVSIQAMVENAARKTLSRASDAYAVKPTDSSFKARIETSLVAGGVDEVLAMEAAEFACNEGKAKNLNEGVDRARHYLKTPRSFPAKKPRRIKAITTAAKALELSPDDYRQAIAHATEEGTKVYAQLQKLGMARPLGELLRLD